LFCVCRYEGVIAKNRRIIEKNESAETVYHPSLRIVFKSSEEQSAGKKGKRVGIAYELENGEIIYVPEGE
jgi:hypothetical protein